MEFRFPDGVGDRYHFIYNVANRSGSESMHRGADNTAFPRRGGHGSGSSLDVQLYTAAQDPDVAMVRVGSTGAMDSRTK